MSKTRLWLLIISALLALVGASIVLPHYSLIAACLYLLAASAFLGLAYVMIKQKLYLS
ncbi:hypothetical protein [Gilvimarinus xylanilyticus]|uniref:Uncharacterized protein n=1 Tax=Gilvimarinus xylanilyticus TaxID=2944139 RepID=A0A9X2HY38_9GAMM|nr:hypothetical protein [Gilvimarinus xylanilyticus]MCP8899214.1 hypothetical protein [Gilvimarinus xylanilyticus]